MLGVRRAFSYLASGDKQSWDYSEASS